MLISRSRAGRVTKPTAVVNRAMTSSTNSRLYSSSVISCFVAVGLPAATSRPPPSSMPPEMNRKIINTVEALDTAASASASSRRPMIMVSATA